MTTRLTALVLMLLDVLASIAVFNLLIHARGLWLKETLVLWPLVPPTLVFMASVYLVQGYKPRTDMLSVDYASQHAIATLGAMLATLVLTFVVFPDGFELQSSRGVIALSFIALIPLTLSYRRLFYLRSFAARRSRSIVFAGDADSCRLFRDECARMGISQPVTYSLIARSEAGPDEASGRFQPLADVLTEIKKGTFAVEAIVLRESARELPSDISQRLVELYFAGIPTYTLELFHEVYWQKIPLYRLNQTWLFQQGFKIAREPVFERIKRVTDIILALFALAAALPFMAAAALAIWVEDRGPALFRQTRIGRNHVPFQLYKLRTMRAAHNGARYTQPGDSRVTRVGRILRITRIDELPQLWNVLRGEMSMIGPRAEWDELVADYERQISCYHFRHLVRPGITGWAQVNYPYGANIDDTLRKLEYDLYYIRHFSFRLDATIVLKTIHVMLFGKGR